MTLSSQEIGELVLASQNAAKLGGEVLTKWLGKTSTTEKGPRDLVTQADFESQTVIREFLEKEFPGHQFVGEEDLETEESPDESDFCWIVDPLDGTTNFVHQLRSFSVSVGLTYKGKPIAGAVLDPMLDELYSAGSGQGATLNGETIKTSDCVELAKSLFVFSFSRGIDRNHPEVTRFLNMLEQVGSIRRLGSAALNLCYVASGRTDGYWATGLSKWDVAAGWLIALEAGATIGDFTGAELDLERPKFCCTATPELFELMKPILNV